MKLDRKLLEHLFITVPTMFGVAYFVLWACAPPAALPPAAPMASPQQAPSGVTGELGLGVMSGGILFFPEAQPFPEAGAWTWLSAHIERPGLMTDVGAVASGALLGGLGGGAFGGYLRVMKTQPTSAFGVEVSGGWLWARLAVPYMKKLDDRRWLYFSPAVTGSLPASVELPVGLVLQTGRLGTLRLESGLAFRVGDGGIGPAAYLALSGSLRFGRNLPQPPVPLNEGTLPVRFPTTNTTSGPKGPPSSLPIFVPTSIPTIIQPASSPAFEP